MKRLSISNGKFVNYIAHDNAEPIPINDDMFHTKTDKRQEEPWEGIILHNGRIMFQLGAKTDMFNFFCNIEPDGAYTLYKNDEIVNEGKLPLHNGKLEGEFYFSNAVLAMPKSDVSKFFYYRDTDLIRLMEEHGITDIKKDAPKVFDDYTKVGKDNKGYIRYKVFTDGDAYHFDHSDVDVSKNATYVIQCVHKEFDGMDKAHEVILYTKEDPLTIKSLPKITYKDRDFITNNRIKLRGCEIARENLESCTTLLQRVEVLNDIMSGRREDYKALNFLTDHFKSPGKDEQRITDLYIDTLIRYLKTVRHLDFSEKELRECLDNVSGMETGISRVSGIKIDANNKVTYEFTTYDRDVFYIGFAARPIKEQSHNTSIEKLFKKDNPDTKKVKQTNKKPKRKGIGSQYTNR